MKGWRKWTYESARVSGSLASENFLITNDRFEDSLDLEIDAVKDQAHLDFPKKAGEMAHAYLLLKEQDMANIIKNGETLTCYDGQNLFDTSHLIYPNNDKTGTGKATSNIIDKSGSNKDDWYIVCNEKPSDKFMFFQNREDPSLVIDKKDIPEKDVIHWYGKARHATAPNLWQCIIKVKGADLTEANFIEAKQKMEGLEYHGGLKLGLKATDIIVPHTLQHTARKLLQAPLVGGGNTNIIPIYGVNVVVSRYI